MATITAIRQVDVGQRVCFYWHYVGDDGKPRRDYVSGYVTKTWNGGHRFVVKSKRYETMDVRIEWEQ